MTPQAESLWAAYQATRTAPAPPEEPPDVERLGDSPALNDALLALVLAGTKRATAGLVADFTDHGRPLPRIGAHWLVADGAGVPRCVLRSSELRIGPLHSVDDAFAFDEGEGDRTRQSWLDGHLRYFTRTLEARGRRWSDDLEVVFERFVVVWPREVAD
ncbi:ASCH domain-containing protein [Blastococcus sp. SYSU D00813]